MPADYLFSAVFIFLISLALSVALTLLAWRIAPLLDFLDRPGGRRKQPHPVPRLGVLPLWGAFTITVLIAQRLPVERGDPYEVIRLAGLLLGGTVLFIFGIFDDKYELPAVPQYIAQIIAAGIAVAFLIFIEQFHNPLTPGNDLQELPYIVTVTVSLFWLGLMMNTLNWLDGVDGLAAGVTLIASGLLFVHALRPEPLNRPELSISLLALALIGTTLGFLLFNWHPAKIFMGSGAAYLGYTLGALSIIGGAKMATILLVMGLPLLDVAWQVAHRLVTGRNPLHGDRGHVHFRLIDARISPRLICLGYYIFCAAFGVLALVMPTGQYKLMAIVIMIGLVLLGFALVARLPRKPD